MKTKLVPAVALALACGSAFGQAWTLDPSYTLSGFGTVGAVKTNTDLAKFATPGQAGGAGTTVSLAPDTNLGLQATGKLNAIFSGTVQILSKQNGSNTYNPSVEWAFAKAQVLPSLGVRVGRIVAPLFAVSDFRNVNYSNLWVRPPLDVYGQVSFSNFDGADASYQANLGSTTVTTQVFYGDSNSVSTFTPVHVKHLAGLNVTGELDDGITLRAGYAKGKLSVDSAAMGALVSIIEATPFAAVGQELDVTDKLSSFAGIGVAVDKDDWVGNFEYTRRRSESYISNTTGWELTVGRRIDKFTPFAVVSRLKVDGNNVVNTIPTSIPQLAPLAYAVDGLVAGENNAQKTVALGVRWDFYRNLDLKAQIDRIKPDGGNGLFNNAQPGFGNSSVNVYSLAVDFVF